MPSTIYLASIDKDENLTLPRGFLPDFIAGMSHHRILLEIDDRRTFAGVPISWNEDVKVHPWQERQVAAILANSDGMIQSPAGSGKTVAILRAIFETQQSACILVHTKDIMHQWKDRIETFLPGTPVGLIGDGTWQPEPMGITVAMVQTLSSRFDQLRQLRFFRDFGFVCLDECHHATAETFSKIINAFSPLYRVGVSATPDKTGDFKLAEMILGSIIQKTRPQEVDTLIVPDVVRVTTKFGFGFRGHQNRWQRSNYPQMIDALISDVDRTALIVQQICANSGHHQLVISKRLAHLGLIRDMLEDEGFGDPIIEIVGANDAVHRRQAVEVAGHMPCVILSTLADEALDIPRLDRLHLTFPQRNTGLVTQQVGRVERQHPDKKDARIYDYVDGNVGPLESQWRQRRFDVYEPRGYKITRTTDRKREE